MSPSDWNGVAVPQQQKLVGQYVTLEPLSLEAHGTALYEASSAPGAEDRFRYMAEQPMDLEEFNRWTFAASQSLDPLFFAVVDNRTDRAEGRQALMRIDTANGVVEVGNIVWGPRLARTRGASEAFFLFADYIFQLGYRRLEWKCNANNEPSKRAAERFGFSSEGVFRQHMVVKGQNRDTAWFSIIDSDWPELRSAFTAWLDQTNFDSRGQQRTELKARRLALVEEVWGLPAKPGR